jgi:hypothetical protein
LFAQEGLYVAPLYQQVQYYPTMSPEAAASLELIGRSATVSSGDELQVQTLEAAAGDYNTLGAWSTPTLYYYTPGNDQQVWQIQKRDPTDPEVHYGDEVSLVNTYYPGQYLMPYWSRVYGSIYLTSTKGDPYYWMVRPAIPV